MKLFVKSTQNHMKLKIAVRSKSKVCDGLRIIKIYLYLHKTNIKYEKITKIIVNHCAYFWMF